jgi:NAD-dependent deacetylase
MGKPKLVVLTGAGISAESGLRTFRDSDGLWEGYQISEVATPRAWKKNPVLVLDFYNQRRKDVLQAIPNAAHLGLAALEEFFEVLIITQNIDNLHQKAGSTKVLHLHGEIIKMRSERNPDLVDLIYEDMLPGAKAPDGGYWRPDIVWFEEPVPRIEPAIAWVQEADVFAVIGTSLVVYPAAGLVNFVRTEVPKFIIDRKIPVTGTLPNLIRIEEPASSGVIKMAEHLKNGVF